MDKLIFNSYCSRVNLLNICHYVIEDLDYIYIQYIGDLHYLDYEYHLFLCRHLRLHHYLQCD